MEADVKSQPLVDQPLEFATVHSPLVAFSATKSFKQLQVLQVFCSHLLSKFDDTADLKNQGMGNILLNIFLKGHEKSVCSGHHKQVDIADSRQRKHSHYRKEPEDRHVLQHEGLVEFRK